MKKRKLTALLLAGALVLTSCQQTVTEESESLAESSAVSEASAAESSEETEASVLEVDLADYTGMTAEEIVASLTLEQKAAQMVQGALYNLDYNEMSEQCYGSVLSHYDIVPGPSVEDWREITDAYQDAALSAPAGIALSGAIKARLPSASSAHKIIPSDTIPASVAGLRFVSTMTVLPTISSGL